MRNKLPKIFIIPHSHIDIEWYWTKQDMQNMMKELFCDSTLLTLANDNNMCFSQDQAVIFEMLKKEASPEQYEFLLKCISEGRVEPVGGLYVQPEVQEPCGESYIRQLQIGQDYFKKTLGRTAVCGWHLDVFGQINQLPQILKQCGIEYFVFMRDVNFNDAPKTFPADFWFKGADGTEILTHWLKLTYLLRESRESDKFFIIGNEPVTVENEKEKLRLLFEDVINKNSCQQKTGAVFLPWGDDLYPHKKSAAEIKDMMIAAAKKAEIKLDYDDIIIATPSRFFEYIKDKADVLPVIEGDFTPPLYTQDLRGTYISRIELKKKNRNAEIKLLSYESFLAGFSKKPENDDELWKRMLFGQFHDTMGGSCIDEVYVDAMKQADSVIDEAESEKQTYFEIAQNKVTVYNPTQYTVNEPVKFKTDKNVGLVDEIGQKVVTQYDSKTQNLVFLAQIGPFSMKEYKMIEADNSDKTEQKVPELLENEFYRIKFDGISGTVNSIFDKTQNKELLSRNANVLVAMNEVNPDMEGALRFDGNEESDENVTADEIICENNAVYKSVKVKKKFMGGDVEKTVLLYNGVKRVEFVTDILDYDGGDRIVCAEFGLNFESPKTVYETPFAIQYARGEIVCAQKWVAAKENNFAISIMNKGTPGHFVQNNKIRMALLRGFSNFELYGELGRNRRFPLFDDGKSHAELAAEKGFHSFSYALTSCEYDLPEICSKANKFNTSPEVYFGGKPEKFMQVIKSVSCGFVVTKLIADDDGYYIRGYNACDETNNVSIELGVPVSEVKRVDLLNNVMCDVEHNDDTVHFVAEKFEIFTLKIIAK